MTKPLNESLKSIRTLFKPHEEAAERALEAIKKAMLSYDQAKKLAADKEEARLLGRVERGTMRFDTASKKLSQIAVQEKTKSSDSGARSTITVTKAYRVVDITLVPVEFLGVDMVRVKSSFKAGVPVPGCEEYTEESIRLS